MPSRCEVLENGAKVVWISVDDEAVRCILPTLQSVTVHVAKSDRKRQQKRVFQQDTEAKKKRCGVSGLSLAEHQKKLKVKIVGSIEVGLATAHQSSASDPPFLCVPIASTRHA
eukprot:Sspe_Gene.15781::Locus_5500_Transcript_1_10_Confidence_0.500_Length_924::g.15781::m.15781